MNNKILLIIIGIVVLVLIVYKPKAKMVETSIQPYGDTKKGVDYWDCSADSVYYFCHAAKQETECCRANVEISSEIKYDEQVCGPCPGPNCVCPSPLSCLECPDGADCEYPGHCYPVCNDLNAYYFVGNYTLKWWAWGNKAYWLESDTSTDLDCNENGCHNTDGRLDETNKPFVISSPHYLQDYITLGVWGKDAGTCNGTGCWATTSLTYTTGGIRYILGCCSDSDCPSNNCIKTGDWTTWNCEPCECSIDDVRLCCDGCRIIPNCTPCDCTTEPCCNGCDYIAGCNPYEIFLEYKNSYLSYGDFNSFVELANGWVTQ